MPLIFSHVQVERDTNPAFPAPVVVGTLTGPDFLYDSVQNYANSYNYRLIAYSKVGIASAPSGANSDTPKQAGTSDIAANSVTANEMAAGTITASSGVIASIDATKITVGTISASQLSATAIDGKTITGSTIQTATSGERITLNEAGDNSLKVYDSTGAVTADIGGANGDISTTSGTSTTSLSGGGLVFTDAGANNTGASSTMISDGPGAVRIDSGYEGGGGPNLAARITISEGDSTLPLSPSVTVTERTGTYKANLLVSGAVVKADLAGNAESWTDAVMGTGWAQGTGIGGSYPNLRWRRDGEDNIHLVGVYHATSTSPSSLMATGLPGVNLGGDVSPAGAATRMSSTPSAISTYVNASGEFRGQGLPTIAVNDTFMINAKIPIGNLV
jgi:hypothetical protein